MGACDTLGLWMGWGITGDWEAVTDVLTEDEKVRCFREVVPIPDADPQALAGLWVD